MGLQKGQREGARLRRYRYGLQEVAKALGITYEATKKAAQRGEFTPGKLETICQAWAIRRGWTPPAQDTAGIPPKPGTSPSA